MLNNWLVVRWPARHVAGHLIPFANPMLNLKIIP
jgi:hypothetical protein